jgi:hypothetical protein
MIAVVCHYPHATADEKEDFLEAGPYHHSKMNQKDVLEREMEQAPWSMIRHMGGFAFTVQRG